jgi:hypothetical protein
MGLVVKPLLTFSRIRKVLDAYPRKDEGWYIVEESKEEAEAEAVAEVA